MKAAANILLCLALAVSLSPARSASYEALSPPVVMALLGNVHNFLACVNLWPFLFLQLLLCLNVKSLWVVLLIPGLSAAGLLAGFIHSSVVLYTGSPVAGMNLYNNGFSGGLVAIVLYPTIMAIAEHRKPVLQEVDYFDQLEGDMPVIPPDPHTIEEEEE